MSLTLIAGGFVIVGALITVLLPYFLNKLTESDPISFYSNYSESSGFSEIVTSTVLSEGSESSSSSEIAVSIVTSEGSNSSIPSLQEGTLSDLGVPLEDSRSNDIEPNTTSSSPISDTPYTFKDERTKVELYSSNSGVAYIYKTFLDENYFKKKIHNDNDEIVGWSITFYDEEEILMIYVYPLPNGYYYVEMDSPIIFIDQNKLNSFVSAELTGNGDLKITFNFRDEAFDLSSSKRIIPGKIYQEID